MRFDLIADHPALDFVATVAERGRADEEKLLAPSDLADWVQQAKILTGRPAVTTVQLAEAVALREAMFRLLACLIDGTVVRAADRALVNQAAAQPGPVPQLLRDGTVRTSGDLPAALAVLARDCLAVAGGPDREALQWCADEACTRPFIDRSRGGRRRWCGMKGCGDRAKAAAYRARRRAAPAAAAS